MKVFFRTKEESNMMQEEEFLKLAPEDRFYLFLALMNKLKIFKTSTDLKKIILKLLLMTNKWKEEIDSFISLSDKYCLKLLLNQKSVTCPLKPLIFFRVPYTPPSCLSRNNNIYNTFQLYRNIYYIYIEIYTMLLKYTIR